MAANKLIECNKYAITVKAVAIDDIIIEEDFVKLYIVKVFADHVNVFEVVLAQHIYVVESFNFVTTQYMSCFYVANIVAYV
ncbi:MAG TPA: hypothetical protein VH797_06265, partial [Nitrososphaeraceae archaeon]